MSAKYRIRKADIDSSVFTLPDCAQCAANSDNANRTNYLHATHVDVMHSVHSIERIHRNYQHTHKWEKNKLSYTSWRKKTTKPTAFIQFPLFRCWMYAWNVLVNISYLLAYLLIFYTQTVKITLYNKTVFICTVSQKYHSFVCYNFDWDQPIFIF